MFIFVSVEFPQFSQFPLKNTQMKKGMILYYSTFIFFLSIFVFGLRELRELRKLKRDDVTTQLKREGEPDQNA